MAEPNQPATRGYPTSPCIRSIRRELLAVNSVTSKRSGGSYRLKIYESLYFFVRRVFLPKAGFPYAVFGYL